MAVRDWTKRVRPLLASACTFLSFSNVFAQPPERLFANSYAIVVGIDDYENPKWPKLNYAVKDAQGIAEYLKAQGFSVTELYDAQATKAAITAAFEDGLIPRLADGDRVVFFFAGHGETRTVGGTERGYLVPIDATDAYSTLIPATYLRDMADAMHAARHQLFVLDSCFGGLAATRSASTSLDPTLPEYLPEITRRRARQLLTAGGANERVRDGGPNGHSQFTGQLLRGLREGFADRNGDGYITFSELAGYIQSAAAAYNQTPGTDTFRGHELGDFIFVNPAASRSVAGTSPASGSRGTSSAGTNVYELLRAGIAHFSAQRFAEARAPLQEAGEQGNAEAMSILAKLYWEGWGVPKDEHRAVKLWRDAAERRHLVAMQALAVVLDVAGPFFDSNEAIRWRQEAATAERLANGIALVNGTGGATKGEPSLPAKAVAPGPPSRLRVVPQELGLR